MTVSFKGPLKMYFFPGKCDRKKTHYLPPCKKYVNTGGDNIVFDTCFVNM